MKQCRAHSRIESAAQGRSDFDIWPTDKLRPRVGGPQSGGGVGEESHGFNAAAKCQHINKKPPDAGDAPGHDYLDAGKQEEAYLVRA